MAYVYRHIRHDKNEPFYIGIGTDNSYKRAYIKSKTKRSEFWHNIAKNGYDVDILFDNISFEYACKKEIEFISIYGRKDIGTGILVNLTNGGEKPPIFFGESNPMKKECNKRKVSLAMNGIKRSNETKKKLSIKAKERNAIPPSRKNCKMSDEGISKMVESRMKNGKLRKIIYQYDINYNLIKIWHYSKDIKICNPKYSIGNIHMVCRKERKIAYNFIWSFTPIIGQ